ncbi:terpene synthase family protein [Kitasatospora aureofaciens]|uniref:terpene synthase family protein n=1 Tax=Kitasatospora aureofaciens TaxID=1894 RepID=UPI001C444BD9|nr:terpene synthase family protein [Kitasatospora aureofaciens]MBV6695619.1 terpene synthase family protein [Kitasatospora aureofaciens]
MAPLELDLPFTARSNPALTRALPGHVGRLRHFGLPVDVYLEQKCPDIVGTWWPQARGGELDLALDFFAWLFLIDDAFDGLGTPEAEKLIRQYERIPGGDTGTIHDGRARFFADIWSRQCDGMSQRYRQRASRNWSLVLDALLTEVVNINDGHFPTIEEYRRIRYRSGYMPLVLDMTERLRRFELPDRVHASPAFRTLYDATAWGANLLDDLFSYEKEAAQGEPHNMVLVVEREHRCTRAEAVHAVTAMLQEHITAFLTAETELPAALDAARIPQPDRANTHAFVGDLRSSLAAAYTWCRSSPRYTGETEWLSFRQSGS